MRELIFIVVITIAAAAFVLGVAMVCVPAAFMVGAVFAALIGWFALSDDDEAAA